MGTSYFGPRNFCRLLFPFFPGRRDILFAISELYLGVSELNKIYCLVLRKKKKHAEIVLFN